MVTRTTTRANKKAARKETIIDTPFIETVTPEAASPEAEDKAFTAYFESLLAGIPSWKRVLCALALSFTVSAGIGYLGSTLVVSLVIGAVVLGSSAFMANIIYVLGMIVAVYASYRAGSFAYMNVIDKTVDAQFSKAKGWVTGLFSSKVATA